MPDALEGGEFSADDIAAELGPSKRTLQRRLSTENITLKVSLDLYRQEQAMLLLQKGERDMGSIAYALGYNKALLIAPFAAGRASHHRPG